MVNKEPMFAGMDLCWDCFVEHYPHKYRERIVVIDPNDFPIL